MSSTENQRGHHASIVVRDSDGRILLVQEEKQEHFGQWNLPGGRIEWREQPSHAAARELEEETGLSLEIRGPFAVYSIVGKGQSTRFLYSADLITGLEAQAGDEILAVKWISLAEIQSMPDADCVAAPVLRHAVEDACDAGPLVYREIDLSLS